MGSFDVVSLFEEEGAVGIGVVEVVSLFAVGCCSGYDSFRVLEVAVSLDDTTAGAASVVAEGGVPGLEGEDAIALFDEEVPFSCLVASVMIAVPLVVVVVVAFWFSGQSDGGDSCS